MHRGVNASCGITRDWPLSIAVCRSGLGHHPEANKAVRSSTKEHKEVLRLKMLRRVQQMVG